MKAFAANEAPEAIPQTIACEMGGEETESDREEDESVVDSSSEEKGAVKAPPSTPSQATPKAVLTTIEWL
ncbi:hypothetical protein EIP86_002382 [Pleurotus ostreatoroseus]|nr:hypothetical protein EIP86_002382 [Pleurotus ostreatoroseus]